MESIKRVILGENTRRVKQGNLGRVSRVFKVFCVKAILLFFVVFCSRLHFIIMVFSKAG